MVSAASGFCPSLVPPANECRTTTWAAAGAAVMATVRTAVSRTVVCRTMFGLVSGRRAGPFENEKNDAPRLSRRRRRPSTPGRVFLVRVPGRAALGGVSGTRPSWRGQGCGPGDALVRPVRLEPDPSQAAVQVLDLVGDPLLRIEAVRDERPDVDLGRPPAAGLELV